MDVREKTAGLNYEAEYNRLKEEMAKQNEENTYLRGELKNMIKGKFVATIEIDIAVDENTPNLLPFEKLKEAVHNDMEVTIKDMMCEEFGDIATVKVTKTFADLYRTEGKHGAD